MSTCFFHVEPSHEVEVQPFFAVVALAMQTRFHRFEKIIDEYAGQNGAPNTELSVQVSQ